MKVTFVIATMTLLAGCSTLLTSKDVATANSDAVSLLLLGDTGYHYDWLEQDEDTQASGAREFVIEALDDWIEKNRPIEEFRLPPMHFAEQAGGYVMASGLWPVSKAARSWCGLDNRCHFGVMLGDNIYPAGATLGADGRVDAHRFDALLWQPYKGLREQDPNFLMYPVLGNHDWKTSRDGAMLQVEYLQASPLYHMDGLFYRAHAAPGVEVFAIDTNVLLADETVYEDAVDSRGTPIDTGVVEDQVAWALPQGAEADMVSWLEQSLAASNARWKLVIGHHPLWASSGTKHEQAKVLRRLLMPVLCRYADAYLAGHDHTLEVHADDCRAVASGFAEVPPLLQVVSGAAGKQRPLHTPFMAWQDRVYPQKKTYFAQGLVWGFSELVLDDETATVHVVSTPDSGIGTAVLRYSGNFARRSGLSREVDQ
jgi:hypothetical protein